MPALNTYLCFILDFMFDVSIAIESFPIFGLLLLSFGDKVDGNDELSVTVLMESPIGTAVEPLLQASVKKTIVRDNTLMTMVFFINISLILYSILQKYRAIYFLIK